MLRQPPPLSSAILGGRHFQIQSSCTDEFPPVEISPTNSTFEFLCRLGSAWNSLVTRLSRSLALDAKANVRPLIIVPVERGVFCRALSPCRTMNEKVKNSSSSLFSRRRKEGGDAVEESGSYTANRSALSGLSWQQTYLDVLDRTLIRWFSFGSHSRRWERIWFHA